MKKEIVRIMDNIIAESKTTSLIIQVSEIDEFIIKGQVLVGDKFNHIGKVDYWSRSLFNINTDE
jgi:hypothetical protein